MKTMALEDYRFRGGPRLDNHVRRALEAAYRRGFNQGAQFVHDSPDQELALRAAAFARFHEPNDGNHPFWFDVVRRTMERLEEGDAD